MLSGDQILRLDAWNLIGTSGNVFDSPCAVIDSSSTPYQGFFHSWNQSATCENPVRESTGKFVAKSEERNRETIPTPRCVRRSPTMGSFFPAGGVHPQNCMTDQSRLQISELQFWQILHTFNVCMLEDKFEDPGKFLFRFSFGGIVMGPRKGRWSVQWTI